MDSRSSIFTRVWFSSSFSSPHHLWGWPVAATYTLAEADTAIALVREIRVKYTSLRLGIKYIERLLLGETWWTTIKFIFLLQCDIDRWVVRTVVLFIVLLGFDQAFSNLNGVLCVLLSLLFSNCGFYQWHHLRAESDSLVLKDWHLNLNLCVYFKYFIIWTISVIYECKRV